MDNTRLLLNLPRAIRHRIGTDVRLAMVVIFGALTVLGVAPFAVMRAVQGEWAAAALDTGLVLLIAGNATYAWRTGRSALVGKVNAIGVTLSCALMAGTLGTAGLFWAYTIILANFMLAPRALAIGCGFALVGAAVLAGPFPTPLAASAFVVSALLVMLYAFIFATLTRVQHGQLEKLATRDPLTGVPNRRAMELELADATALHRARREAATLAVLDLDHFKQINDQHGHDAGDRVLVEFAALMQDSLRKRDRLFRFGGEEFVLLLPGTDAAGARATLEKLQQRLHGARLGPDLAVTMSVGATSLAPHDDWPAWLSRADAALYRAKREGRDRTVFTGDAPERGERRLQLVG